MNVIVALCSLAVSVVALAATPADKGVYQWGVEVDGVISKETKKPPRAYLWIPEKCESLKAREGKVENPNGFYIREGAARVDEKGNVQFLPLPTSAKRPAFVTLCAYERNSDGDTIYEFRRMAHP